jgi:hypothetical protein
MQKVREVHETETASVPCGIDGAECQRCPS